MIKEKCFSFWLILKDCMVFHRFRVSGSGFRVPGSGFRVSCDRRHRLRRRHRRRRRQSSTLSCFFI